MQIVHDDTSENTEDHDFVTHCQCCGEPITTWTWGLEEYGECRKRDCALYTVTLGIDLLATLTPEQIEGYGMVNARRRLQRATELVALFGEAGQQ